MRDMCEEIFSDFSFAYRRGRGVTDALSLFCVLGNEHSFAAKLDPVNCFDNMDFDVLYDAVCSFVSEKTVRELIMSFAKMPVFEDGKCISREKGLLQGAPLSSMLCNIYFHSLDMYLEKENVPFIRYADDIVVFADSAAEINESFEKAGKYLEQKLALQRNTRKCKIAAPIELCFLGNRFERDRYGLVALQTDIRERTAYYDWYTKKFTNTRNNFDITDDGILRQKDGSLIFSEDSTEKSIPIIPVNNINIYSNVCFDTGALTTALKYGICINAFDKNNKLIGRFTPNGPLISPLLTQKQLALYENPQVRAEIASRILYASLHNSVIVLRYYAKTGKSKVLDSSIKRIKAIMKKIQDESEYTKLLMDEAQAREYYYECYDEIIADSEFTYVKRTRRPPRNEFNALLSFGNAVLYNIIATEINKTALDIRVGYLHATNRRMESLNLDIAEIFKPLVVDRVIFSLINKKELTLSHFEAEENGAVLLAPTGKRILLRAFYDKLESTISINGSSRSYYSIIKDEIYSLIKYVKGQGEYTPFKQVR